MWWKQPHCSLAWKVRTCCVWSLLLTAKLFHALFWFARLGCRWWPSPCGHFHFCPLSLMLHRPWNIMTLGKGTKPYNFLCWSFSLYIIYNDGSRYIFTIYIYCWWVFSTFLYTSTVVCSNYINIADVSACDLQARLSPQGDNSFYTSNPICVLALAWLLFSRVSLSHVIMFFSF